MKSELDLLIELLEEERKNLEIFIKDNLQEHEYLSVYHHGEAWIKINSKLHLLNCFKDPFYEREDRLNRMMSFDSVEENEFLKSFWAKRLAVEREEIEKLRNQSGAYFNDTQEIDDALFKLYEGSCSKFHLHLSHRGEPFSLEFKMAAEQVLSIMVEVKELFNTDDPDDPETNQVNLFKNLGFKYDKPSDLMIYSYNMHDFKDATAIKTILARIIYDIGYAGDDHQAKLEFFY